LRHATANLENVWNGRPISKILLAEPIEVLDEFLTMEDPLLVEGLEGDQ